MNCPQIQTELSAYVDGELPPSIRAEVEAHIEGCAACRKRLAELRKLAEGVAALPKPQPAPQFLAAVRRKIAHGETPEQRNWIDLLFRPVWVKVPIEVVALAAILVVAAVLVTPPRRNTAQQTLAMNRNESTPAERAEARANGREVLTAGGGKSGAGDTGGGVASHGLGVPAFGLAVPVSGIVRYGERQPVETIVVEAEDSLTVLAHAEMVASSLGGRVETSKRASGAVQSFFVELPTEKVTAFKTQFANQFVSPSRLISSTGAAVDRFSTPASSASAPAGALTEGRKPQLGDQPSGQTTVAATASSGAVGAPFVDEENNAAANRPQISLGGSPLTPQAVPKQPLEPEEPLPAAPLSTTVLEIQVVTPGR
jgi:anti-sigma factor RsiW